MNRLTLLVTCDYDIAQVLLRTAKECAIADDLHLSPKVREVALQSALDNAGFERQLKNALDNRGVSRASVFSAAEVKPGFVVPSFSVADRPGEGWSDGAGRPGE